MIKKIIYTDRDVKSINVVLGENLKAARKNTGMSQTDVMKAIWGVANNRNRISEIETGKKTLSVIDLLKFQKLYGQSLDYMCGLSVEPEIDMLAGTVNHVVDQSRSLVDMLTGELASVIVNHVKTISQNDYAALLSAAQSLVTIIRASLDVDSMTPQLNHHLNTVTQVIRSIEVKQARQARAVDMQMAQITQRIDKEDGHRLQSDMDKHYQYSIPMPSPYITTNEHEVIYG